MPQNNEIISAFENKITRLLVDGKFDELKKEMELMASENISDYFNRKLLFISCQHHYVGMIKYLLENFKVNINFKFASEYNIKDFDYDLFLPEDEQYHLHVGFTPLQVAITGLRRGSDCYDIYIDLLKRNSEKKGSVFEVVHLLLQHSPDLAVPNAEGRTAFDLAMRKDFAVLNLLILYQYRRQFTTWSKIVNHKENVDPEILSQLAITMASQNNQSESEDRPLLSSTSVHDPMIEQLKSRLKRYICRIANIDGEYESHYMLNSVTSNDFKYFSTTQCQNRTLNCILAICLLQSLEVYQPDGEIFFKASQYRRICARNYSHAYRGGDFFANFGINSSELNLIISDAKNHFTEKLRNEKEHSFCNASLCF